MLSAARHCLLASTATLLLFCTPAHALPSLKVAAPPAADPGLALAGSIDRPVLRVGEAVPLHLDPEQGTWQLHEDGSATWSLLIETENATHVGLMLQDVRLPDGAEIFMEQRDTPSPRWSRARRDRDGRSWLAAQPGDRMTLHVIVPDAATMSELRLGAAELLYGTHDLSGRSSRVGSSGACQNNVVCPQGDGWGSPIRATARILIGGQLLCSAVLVNNTNQDGRPLMLTAEHCGIGDESDRFPAQSVTVLFNFQSSSCNSNSGVSTGDTLQGERLLFRHSASDVALFELEQAPPAAFNAVYAGWDVTGSGVSSGAGVHHPSGDLKKISLFNTRLQRQRVSLTRGGLLPSGSQQVDSWRVMWADGTTERGSSGSGLWNPQRRVIGLLSGGDSACAAPSGGLLGGGLLGANGGSDNPGPDFYGRLEVAWTAAGRLGTPLRDILDPRRSSGGIANARSATGDSLGDPVPTGQRSSGQTGGLLLLLLGLATIAGLRRGQLT